MKITRRVTYKGHTYDVVTNEAEREAPLCVYCLVYPIDKDGNRRPHLVTDNRIFTILRHANATKPLPPKVEVTK